MRPPQFAILGDSPVEVQDDCLNFGRFVEPFADRLLASRKNTPFTVGIFAEWGQGKTSVMHMLQSHLKDRGCPTIWFDPWKYNTRESVWKGLALTLITDLRTNDTLMKEIRRKRSGLENLVAQLLLSWTVGEKWAKTIVDAVKEEPWSPSLLHELESTLATLFDLIDPKLGQFDKPVVLFVDDLDRCLPEPALAVLEALKLVLNKPGLITIMGIAEAELSRTVLAAYARELGMDTASAGASAKSNVDPRWGSKYIRKIIQIPFPLPELSVPSLEGYVEQCLKKSNVESVLGGQKGWHSVIREACEGNLREVKRFINNFISEIDKAEANATSRLASAVKFDKPRVAFVLLLAWRFREFLSYVRRSDDPEALARYVIYFRTLAKEGQADLSLLGKDRTDHPFVNDDELGRLLNHCFTSPKEDQPPLVVPFAKSSDLEPYLQFGVPLEEVPEHASEMIPSPESPSVSVAGIQTEISEMLSNARSQIAARRLDEAEGTLRRAAELARINNDGVSETAALKLFGALQTTKGHFDEALRTYTSVLEMAKTVSDKQGEWSTLLSMAGIHRQLAQFPRALELAERALAITHDIGDRLAEASALEELAATQKANNNFQLALEAYERALEIARDLHHESREISLLIAIGDVARSAKDFGKGEELYKDAGQRAKELGDKHAFLQASINLAELKGEQEDFQAALTYYEIALQQAQELQDAPTRARVLSGIGFSFERLNELPSALRAYEETVRILSELSGDEPGVGELGAVIKGNLDRVRGKLSLGNRGASADSSA